jgi:ribosomal protein L24
MSIAVENCPLPRRDGKRKKANEGLGIILTSSPRIHTLSLDLVENLEEKRIIVRYHFLYNNKTRQRKKTNKN